MKRLVVTSPPLPTESLNGYVLRLTELNGYPSSTFIFGYLRKATYGSKLGVIDPLPLKAIAGITDEQTARLSQRREHGGTQGMVRFLGQDVVTSDLRRNAPKICPLCVLETGACEALWDLSMVTACPVHRIRLLDRCEECKKPLRWIRKKIGECRCGADLLAQVKHSYVDDALVDLMCAYRALLYRDQTIQAMPAGMKHLNKLDVFALSKLCWVLAGVLRGLDGNTKLVRARYQLSVELEGVAKLLSDWPNNFQRFLRDAYGSKLENEKFLPCFRSTFSWALTRLDKNIGSHAESMSFLLQEVYQFAANYWSRDKLIRVGESPITLPDKMRWGTLGEAAAITGLQIGTLKKHIAKGDVPTRRTVGKPSRSYLVDLDWARNRQMTKYPALGLRAAAKRIELSIWTLRELRIRGIYQVRHHGEFCRNYTEEDLAELASRIKHVSDKILRALPKNATTLDTVFRFQVTDGKDKAKFIAALLDGSLKAIGRLDVSPAGLVIPIDEVSKFIDAMSPYEGQSVTHVEAARRLYVSNSIIDSLRAGGHLQTQIKRGRSQIMISSLNEFNRKYALLSNFARQSGFSSKAIMARVGQSDINLIALKNYQYTTWLIPIEKLSKLDAFLRC